MTLFMETSRGLKKGANKSVNCGKFQTILHGNTTLLFHSPFGFGCAHKMTWNTSMENRSHNPVLTVYMASNTKSSLGCLLLHAVSSHSKLRIVQKTAGRKGCGHTACPHGKVLFPLLGKARIGCSGRPAQKEKHVPILYQRKVVACQNLTQTSSHILSA